MSTFTVRKRAPASKAFWENNAFWIVVMPTSLVGLVFILAMVARVWGH